MQASIHNFERDQTYTEKPGHLFALYASFEGVNAANCDALMIAGGRAPEYLRLNQRVLDVARQFAQAGQPVAAICHGANCLPRRT